MSADEYQKLLDEIDAHLAYMKEKYGPPPPLPQTLEERQAFGARLRARAAQARKEVGGE
jgi:hypothetical protein